VITTMTSCGAVSVVDGCSLLSLVLFRRDRER
jgi:hypothetical protein